jgi:2-polyprenyl-3-methyl-5-hydroxy-6-metoxy-1,4-benzoquinol methylase
MQWLAELDRADIPYKLVRGDTSAFEEIERAQVDEVLMSEVTSSACRYSKSEVENIIKSHTFGYHRIDLPYGLRTGGDDRSATADCILPSDMSGMKVLDVGCAYGALCFEAEQRGAASVTGFDVNGDRLAGARVLADILGSTAEFVQRDIVQQPISRSYDLILLLNVVHHLGDPIAVLRNLAAHTSRLIVEFPTLEDPHFLNTIPSRRLASDLNDLPLIGVSSQRMNQTFVFTKPAFERLLSDHVDLASSIRFRSSPIPGRLIAFVEPNSGPLRS